MEFEYMWRGGPRLRQAEGVFPLGTDAVLLADFIRPRAGRACDIGCGGGCISLSLAFRCEGLRIDALDISAEAAEIARENVALNGLGGRISVLNGDVREYKGLFAAGAYDLVFSNPPYFADGSGRVPADRRIAAARGEKRCSLGDITEAAGWLLRWGGRFCAVYRPERLAELICSMAAAGIEPKRLRTVHYRAQSAPSLILIEGMRGARPGLSMEPPLVMTGPDGSESAEIKRIYMREED